MPSKAKLLLLLSLPCSFLLLWLLPSWPTVAHAQDHTPTALFPIYLPLVNTSAGGDGKPGATPTAQPTSAPTATPTPQPGTAPQGAVWLPYRRSDNKVLPTYGASVAVDGQGGIHAAYSLLSATNEAEGGYITYAYCPANCTVKENWRFVHLGDGSEVRLQVDQGGRPRLLMMTPGPTQGQAQHLYFSYGACDIDCTNAASWTLTPLVDTLDCIACIGGREQMNHQYFALDPQGHPAFVFPSIDPNEDWHAKLYYFSCMQEAPACNQVNRWSAIQVGDGSYPYQPSLVFAGVEQPRLVYQIGNSQHSELYYLACARDCANGNWAWQEIVATSIRLTVRFDLAVNQQGQPRLAFYSSYENRAPSPFADSTLYYIWCDANCTANQAGAWQATAIGLPSGAGEAPALALDQQGRPRIAFMTHDQGLGYSWCNTDCESTSGVWQHGVAESNNALSSDYDVLPIHRCTVSTWFTGVRPALVLDGQGNPRIAYDAQHYWYGVESTGGAAHDCNIKDINVTRLAMFNQP